MPKSVPRTRLEERVRARFLDRGTPPKAATRLAETSVDAFYAEDLDHPHASLVAQEALAIITESMPPVVTAIREAFESMRQAVANMSQAVAQFDFDCERLDREYPTDQITGAPHHYVINGDHDACNCGGHLVECTTYDDPHWRHAPSICGITRTLCNHAPKHTYREPCEDYAADPPQAVGRPQGCVAHGGPDCVCEVDNGSAVD